MYKKSDFLHTNKVLHIYTVVFLKKKYIIEMQLKVSIHIQYEGYPPPSRLSQVYSKHSAAVDYHWPPSV